MGMFALLLHHFYGIRLMVTSAADYNGWRRPGRRIMNRTKDNIEM